MAEDDNKLELSEDSIHVIRDIFQSKDVNNDGYINTSELDECDGKLSIDELIANLHVINAHSLRGDEILEAFKVFDKNGDGFIRLPELNKILTANGAMTGEESAKLIDELVREFDKNHDGKFDYSEFVSIFMSDKNPLQLKGQ
ncbi:hypothetical protein LSH36_250g00022 [Paralvinella palmiformis]|uniref:EF-hand domain-containing protein n=1 Tax=Paralvinella palmiformis TaxID=53620 RepID=A0AAD9JL39_9ANNE|nr:hypothetical protein LSH36_250g00022 [Paralvinella palmiformis]